MFGSHYVVLPFAVFAFSLAILISVFAPAYERWKNSYEITSVQVDEKQSFQLSAIEEQLPKLALSELCAHLHNFIANDVQSLQSAEDYLIASNRFKDSQDAEVFRETVIPMLHAYIDDAGNGSSLYTREALKRYVNALYDSYGYFF